MVAIQTHDGLYDPANDKYLKGIYARTKTKNFTTFYSTSGRYDGCSN